MSETSTNSFDVIVVGGGSGGYSTALRAAQLGLTVALIEKGSLGGTCLHAGCIPTKALLHAAEVAEETRHAAKIGVQATFDGIDVEALQKFKSGVVNRLYKGLQGLVGTSDGVTMIQGAGRLTSPTTVVVDETTYTATSIVIATGSTARLIPGIELSERVLTSTEALELTEVPNRVVVMGGSVIGVEFASLWRSFGAEVTVVEVFPTLVPKEDAILSKQLERAFRKRGIKIHTNTAVSAVEETGDGVAVLLDSGEKIEADYVLVAVGRVPFTEGLGLEEVGVQMNRSWVATDERLATNVPGIYAVGDVVEGLQLAHRGFAHGIFVAEEIGGLKPSPIKDINLPRVTYCQPEIASVGLTEAEAREAHTEIETFEYNLAGNGRSQILGTTGVIKMIRVSDGPIVGIHMIGDRLSEQIGEAAMIVDQELSPWEVSSLIHAHPTQNEALGEAALALAGRPLHTHA